MLSVSLRPTAYRRRALLFLCLAHMGCASSETANSAQSTSPTPVDGTSDSGITPVSPTPLLDAGPINSGMDAAIDPGPVEFEAAGAMFPRLTATQHRNTLEDLFGDDIPETTLEADTNPNLFYSIGAASTDISTLGVERYGEAAFIVAEHIFSSAERRDALLGCVPADANDACVDALIRELGRRLYRRPLSEDEVTRWRTLIIDTADGDLNRGLRFAVAGLLQSPHFLYRAELGEDSLTSPGKRHYTAFEMASRLAFLLTNSTPDDELLNAAERGELLDDESLLREAERLMAQPRAKTASQDFFYQFLDLGRLDGIDRDPTSYPEFSRSLLWAMGIEVRLLVDDLIFRQPRDIRGLFFERRAYLNSSLAALYQVDAVGATLGRFVPVDFEADTPRAGLLTTAAFLSMNAHQSETSPTLRGKYVRERLFCQSVPAPPDEIDLNLDPDPSEPRTLRERLEAHRDDPACSNCHAFIDPPGMLFENYDSLGRYRTEDNGYPIDATGHLDGVPLDDAVALADHLRTHPLVGPCITRQFHRHAQGRLETAGERYVLDQVAERFADRGHRFDQLIYGYVLSPLFRAVGPQTEEESP